MSRATSEERSSQYSSKPASPLPGWARPRSPLPPHRLAKLANALGVSTPLPATSPSPSLLSPSASFPGSSPSSLNDQSWRSPTPSATSTQSSIPSASPSQSKFLIHVIPPHHLPHDSDDIDSSDLTPPPATASGYHVQFRRGTLVALQPSMQAQLWAIAREYALPSTAGLVLYLVSSTETQSRKTSLFPSMPPTDDLADAVEPGPRLSEEIWKHIWKQVLKAEREETRAHAVHSRSAMPNPLGKSSSRRQHKKSKSPLPSGYAPDMAGASNSSPITPSSSSPSSISDARPRSKFASSSMTSMSQSEPDTPDTERSSGHEFDSPAPGINLPGLHSPSLIPILAKFEFDIDRRKAPWYEPWLRSRRRNQAKRADSRMSNRQLGESSTDDHESSGEARSRILLDLTLVDRLHAPQLNLATSLSSWKVKDSSNDPMLSVEEPGMGGYAPLSGSPENMSFNPDAVDLEDHTARLNLMAGSQDPLKDVFGSDADTWSGIRAQSQRSQRLSNPNIIDLAFDAASLATQSEASLYDDDGLECQDDVKDVDDILKKRPSATVSISSISSQPLRRKSISSTGGVTRRQAPPPLMLVPKTAVADVITTSEASPMAYNQAERPDSTILLETATPLASEMPNKDITLSPQQEHIVHGRIRSPLEDKRGGGFFDDLDLGFEFPDEEEYDDNDPNDRRKSQWIMKAKLDEIERNLVQFSPRKLDSFSSKPDFPNLHEKPEATDARSTNAVPPFTSPFTPDLDCSAELNNHRGTIRYDESPMTFRESPSKARSSTPTPSLKSRSNPSSSPSSSNHQYTTSPPRLVVNGVSASPSNIYVPRSRTSSRASNTILPESDARMQGDDVMYPPLLSPSFSRKAESALYSPVIPLSPDPFGRYPSSPEPASQQPASKAYWNHSPQPMPSEYSAEPRPSLSSTEDGSQASHPSSSRFSADSATGSLEELAGKSRGAASIVSVKGIKSFWRKSQKSSISGPLPLSASSRTSFQLPAVPGVSHEQAAVPLSAAEQQSPVPVALVSTSRHKKKKSSVDHFHFDQESPYPVHLPVSRTSTSNPPTPSVSPIPGGSAPLSLEGKSNGRKSILKSWKSSSGAQLSHSSSSGSEGRSPNDPPPARPELAKQRRPSIVDMAAGAVIAARSSLVSHQHDIPPSPQLPDEFVSSNLTARMNSNGMVGHQRMKSSGRSKTLAVSTPMEASPPRTHSPAALSVASRATQPSPSRSVRSLAPSEDMQRSFDSSQFEMVSPPKVHPNLSYPYRSFDHD